MPPRRLCCRAICRTSIRPPTLPRCLAASRLTESARACRPTFDEARALVAALAPRPRLMKVPLADALGRMTAADIRAARDHPAFDASAMDGFAFAARDVSGATADCPVTLPVGGESRAGGALPSISEGAACVISTGAMMPPEYDTVIATERASVTELAGRMSLRFDAPETAGRNVRRRGEDVRAGELVLPIGSAISPETIGALGCFGLVDLPVWAQPRVAIIPTGDELVGHGTPSGIADSNGPMIAAATAALGLPVTRSAPVADCPRSIENALRAALTPGSADIIISTGGVSVGNHDHVSATLRAMGATVHFHGARMRPGKPILFATFENGPMFFGLPGNPVAALVGFRFFVSAAIRAMAGRPLEKGQSVPADLPTRPGTTLLLKARQSAADGGQSIEILPDQRSHMMRPLLSANRWLAVDEEASLPRARCFPLAATLE
ncbi:MAG: molybdopterin molybdotransferase MoeA [Candidatus Sphingomonas phytovorans]|nr:molybdopterin molybdotransferase MoeA [Sphingomonas sp.]WEK00872.1 MAG: molybdopterin molybdotransferase MoeA [Sphingomonas sp.]